MIFWHRFGTTSTNFLFLTYHHKVIILSLSLHSSSHCRRNLRSSSTDECGSCSFFLFHIASQQRCIVLPVRKHVATVSIAFSYCDLRFGIIFSDCFLTDQMRISVPEFKKQVQTLSSVSAPASLKSLPLPLELVHIRQHHFMCHPHPINQENLSCSPSFYIRSRNMVHRRRECTAAQSPSRPRLRSWYSPDDTAPG